MNERLLDRTFKKTKTDTVEKAEYDEKRKKLKEREKRMALR